VYLKIASGLNTGNATGGIGDLSNKFFGNDDTRLATATGFFGLPPQGHSKNMIWSNRRMSTAIVGCVETITGMPLPLLLLRGSHIKTDIQHTLGQASWLAAGGHRGLQLQNFEDGEVMARVALATGSSLTEVGVAQRFLHQEHAMRSDETRRGHGVH